MPESSQVTLSTKKPRPRRALPFLFFLALLLLAAAFAYRYVRDALAPASAASTPTEFEVEAGWGGKRVASELERAGLIRDARVFGFYLQWRDLDHAIGEGLYTLDPALSAAELAEALSGGGRPRTTFVIVPEGYRLEDVARRFEEAELGDAAVLEALLRAPGDLRPAYLPEGAPLEGYLFPAGYELPAETNPETFVRAMLERFDAEVTDVLLAALEERGLTVNDWVTLASMIQAEAADATEMPIISGVFWNRLDRQMLLQSDPTVAYGLGKTLPELDAVAGDMQSDTPWNTYLYPGLPRTPINNPGEDALAAVLEPVRRNEAGQDYLFFLHGAENGEIVFRPNVSLEDHNRDVQQYLR